VEDAILAYQGLSGEEIYRDQTFLEDFQVILPWPPMASVYLRCGLNWPACQVKTAEEILFEEQAITPINAG